MTNYIHHWYWFLISLIVCGVAAFVYVRTHPQESRVCASILTSQDDATATMLNGLGGLLGADAYVQDEIFVITSHSVLVDVAKTLQVNKKHYVKTGFLKQKFEYPAFPVDVYSDANVIDTLKTTIRFDVEIGSDGLADIEAINTTDNTTLATVDDVSLPATVETDYGQYIVNTTETYVEGNGLESKIYVTGYDSAAEDLAAEIEAEIASKKSNVIELAIETTNAEYGVDVLNEVMKEYNERGIEDRNKRAQKTADFLAERLAMISADLNNAETEIEKYKERNGLVDVAAETAYNTSKKAQVESKLIALETQLEILKMTVDFISQPDNKYELLPTQISSMGGGESGVGSDAASVMGSYNELVLRRINLLNTARADNRAIRQIEQQIDAMRGNIKVALDQSIKNTNVQLRDMRTQYNLATSSLGNVPTQEREMLNLARQQKVKQELYLFLLQRSEETAMLIANAVPKGIVVDSAYVMRDPVGAGKWVILLISIIIGVFIPILVLYIRGLLRTKIESLADLRKLTDMPLLGEMCIDKSGESIVVESDSTSSTSELFRMLRTNLKFVLSNPGDKVVMVTSSTSGEGKSFISTNLTASIALLNKRVVLVGMDIRRPQLANYLGIASTPGLTQYLSDHSMTIADIVRPYEPIPGMDVIVAGPVPPNPGEMMTSSRLAQLVEELRREYDYVVLDTAPVGLVSDSFQVSPLVDATVFVVRVKKTRMQDIRELNALVAEGRLKRANLVLNGSMSRKGYGYGSQKK